MTEPTNLGLKSVAIATFLFMALGGEAHHPMTEGRTTGVDKLTAAVEGDNSEMFSAFSLLLGNQSA